MRTKKFSKEEKEILTIIGKYFREDIDELRILDIEFDKDQNKIHILLSRPGLLIGKKGRHLYGLIDIINKFLKPENELTFEIHESTIDQHLHMWAYLEEYVYSGW